MNRKIIAIVPAAGMGSRAQTSQPKQYQLLAGQAMLRRTVDALLADIRIEQVRVAVASQDVQVEQVLAGLLRTTWQCCGGVTRAHTVLNAIRRAQNELNLHHDDWILVHDAARPGLSVGALGRLIDACLENNHGGLLAVPVADTVKRAQVTAETLPSVTESVPRDSLWLAQTPQMFPVRRLHQALEQALALSNRITDESSAMESRGYSPLLIRGELSNFKVTWPEDFELMARWLDMDKNKINR